MMKLEGFITEMTAAGPIRVSLGPVEGDMEKFKDTIEYAVQIVRDVKKYETNKEGVSYATPVAEVESARKEDSHHA